VRIVRRKEDMPGEIPPGFSEGDLIVPDEAQKKLSGVVAELRK